MRGIGPNHRTNRARIRGVGDGSRNFDSNIPGVSPIVYSSQADNFETYIIGEMTGK